VAEPSQASLEAALADLMEWFATAHISGMLIGGVAASILGRPRLTRDIDALAILPEARWAGALEAAAQFGIVPRLVDALDFARRSRVLLLRHAGSGIDLDITLGVLPFEEQAVARSERRVVGRVSLTLPRVEDLVVMKAVARRPKDLEDIRGLLAAHPELDTDTTRRWVREFATAAGMADMLEEFERLLADRSPPA
jgi:hypothetical protein